jgi:hypothetical protein
MPGFWRSFPLTMCALLLASAAYPQHTPIEKQLPCESYSQSAAVFIGVASAPVKRWVQLPNHPPIEMKLTPMMVERAYVGVSTPVIYLMPLGIEHYATPGQRYVVYGRGYHQPDIVMASPGFGAKEIDAAGADLAFLETLVPGLKGGTISGVVRLKDLTYDRTTRAVTPLDQIVVRIFNDEHSTETVTTADGRFSVAVPAGTYQIIPQLPQDLVVWDATSRIQTIVGDAGCTVVTIDTLFNGRVRGVLRGPDGRPLGSTSVDLMPIDIEPEPTTGQINGTGSVGTNDKGEFEFTGRPAGRYYLGVNLYNAPNPYGPSYPRTYYPGTTDRNSAVPIVVERGRSSDGFDLSVPIVLPKGELAVIVESDHPGELKLCYVQLEDLFSRWSSYRLQPGVPHRFPVVDGQRYQVHVHLEFSGRHLESEPFVFTATTGKTVVTLRPDAPRRLHR